MAEPDERRRFPRFASRILVRLTRLDEAAWGELSSTRDLSLGGCTVAHDLRLEAGTPLRLVLCLGDSVIEAYGRVVHERARGDGCFDLGIQFLQMPATDHGLLEGFFEPRP